MQLYIHVCTAAIIACAQLLAFIYIWLIRLPSLNLYTSSRMHHRPNHRRGRGMEARVHSTYRSYLKYLEDDVSCSNISIMSSMGTLCAWSIFIFLWTDPISYVQDPYYLRIHLRTQHETMPQLSCVFLEPPQQKRAIPPRHRQLPDPSRVVLRCCKPCRIGSDLFGGVLRTYCGCYCSASRT